MANDGDAAMTRLLLEAGCDVDPRSILGETPLMSCAAAMDQIYFDGSNEAIIPPTPRLATLKLLVDAGADVKATNHVGRTALHAVAACPGIYPLMVPHTIEALTYLLAQGADARAQDLMGITPLELFRRRYEEFPDVFAEIRKVCVGLVQGGEEAFALDQKAATEVEYERKRHRLEGLTREKLEERRRTMVVRREMGVGLLGDEMGDVLGDEG